MTYMNPRAMAKQTFAPMVWIDWVYAISLAASLALAIGAICVLLFAM